jgi:uncharacterized membrane protein YdjX (TVP38/TMEM64 family)
MEEEIIVKKEHNWIKIIIFLVLVIAGILLFSFTSIGTYLRDVNFMKEQVGKAGILGYLVYIILFVGLSLMVLPMTFLMFIAMLIFSPLEGIFLTYIATLISATCTFYIGRWMGGGSLSGIKNKFAQRAIAGAEKNPYRTIIILRSLMQLSPLIGYSLALTKISPQKFILGNIVGLIIPIFYMGLAFILMESTVLRLMGVHP